MIDSGGSWFERGGLFNDGSNAGTFNFNYTRGTTNSGCGFRTILITGSGL